MDYDLTLNSKEEGRRYVRDRLITHFGVSYTPIADGDEAADKELDYKIAEKILASVEKSFVVTNVVRPSPNTMDAFNAGQHEYMQYLSGVVTELRELAGKQSSTEYKF